MLHDCKKNCLDDRIMVDTSRVRAGKLAQQRFKGVGMRWSEDGFNHLLHLGARTLASSFEALFQVQLQPSPNT